MNLEIALVVHCDSYLRAVAVIKETFIAFRNMIGSVPLT
jgi:hypothetical protein